VIQRLRAAWARLCSTSRGHREDLGGFWMETARGWWFQAIVGKPPFWALMVPAHVRYLGVRRDGTIEVSSASWDHHGVRVVMREDGQDVKAMGEAFETLLGSYLRARHPLPKARTVTRD
jgi:hypothetical protein